MSLAATTLSTAIGVSDTTIVVASATNIAAPNFTSGSTVASPGAGVTYLLVEQEMMLVLTVSGTFIGVQRGVFGTPTASHGVTTPVISGLPSDFPQVGVNLGPATAGGGNLGATGFAPAVKAFTPFQPYANVGFSAPVASSATIVATGPFFHVTGTTATNIITPPLGMVEGWITIVADLVWTFTSSAVTNGIAATGTVTTAKSAISFYLDQNTALWYPSRLA